MERKRKSGFNAGLSFGIVVTTVSILQNFLTADEHTFAGIMKSIAEGLITGSLSGVLVGWLVNVFTRSKFIERTTRMNIEPGETILFETPANHFKEKEGVEGKLYLTTNRLVFKPHTLNIQNHQLSIKLNDIDAVDRYKTMHIVNNCLFITTNKNITEKFVVEEAEQWAEKLPGKKQLIEKD